MHLPKQSSSSIIKHCELLNVRENNGIERPVDARSGHTTKHLLVHGP
jgi:hypothetical protein